MCACVATRRVELAIWTHYVAVQLQPDLLDRLPLTNTINSGSTELETQGCNDDEETIKTSTSDAEITADENSTDVVSSTKDDDETTTDGDLKNGKCKNEFKW